jgi:hypothetical protein
MIREDPYIVHLHCCPCRAQLAGVVLSSAQGTHGHHMHVSSKIDLRPPGTSIVGGNWICCTWRICDAARVLCKCLEIFFGAALEPSVT